MKIVLLGANGRTGREILRLALEAGDTVTGLVRSADSLGDVRHDRLHVHVGNVCDPEVLKAVFQGHDTVISTVGPRTPTKSACTIYPESAESIVEAMQFTGLKRVLITSTALLFPPAKILDYGLRFIARNNYAAARLMEECIRDTDLDWTLARTGFLNDKGESGYRKAVNAMPDGGGSISRSALAQFLFAELKQAEHIRDIVGLCSAKES